MIGRVLPAIWIGLAALLLALSGRATAHLTPNSEVRLTFGNEGVTADIIVPQGEYAFATGNPTDNSDRSRAIAQRYLAEHIRVWGPDGRVWQVIVERPEFVQIAGPPDLHAVASLRPPRGQDAGNFTLDWRVLIGTLPSHFALIVIEAAGRERTIVGAVRTGNERLVVEQTEGPFAILRSAMVLGAHHIASGFDHLLFLLALLLPAPLIARSGAWREKRHLRATLGQLARIVTAFTIGHSLTLVGATMGGWRLPTAPVEILIAVSVLVSALHAIRPMFPGREAGIAGGFGLVHGLAFATLVEDAGAGLANSATGLFGFNLGIEIVQLAVVIVVVPPLVLLSRMTVYPALRTTAGALCAAAAGVWITSRSVEALPQVSSGAIAFVATSILVTIGILFASRAMASQRPFTFSDPDPDSRGPFSRPGRSRLCGQVGETNQ